MTEQEALRLGIPSGMYSAFAHLTVEEAKTQKCDCGRVMVVHPDARWRFQGHVIRCVPCQKKAEAAGYNTWEAMYVE